jgi:hypothetical protein
MERPFGDSDHDAAIQRTDDVGAAHVVTAADVRTARRAAFGWTHDVSGRRRRAAETSLVEKQGRRERT